MHFGVCHSLDRRVDCCILSFSLLFFHALDEELLPATDKFHLVVKISTKDEAVASDGYLPICEHLHETAPFQQLLCFSLPSMPRFVAPYRQGVL